MNDLLMMLLLLAAFAGAVAYVLICDDITVR